MIALAFRHDTGGALRYLIARVTGAPVHVALMFGATTIEADSGGVKKRPTTEALARGRWTIVPIRQGDTDAMLWYARSQVGHSYDWWGVLVSWWLGRDATGRPKHWFCSELAAATLMAGGVELQPARASAYTPRRLYDTLVHWRIA